MYVLEMMVRGRRTSKPLKFAKQHTEGGREGRYATQRPLFCTTLEAGRCVLIRIGNSYILRSTATTQVHIYIERAAPAK